MSDLTTIPTAELANLEERLRKLATDKSNLQLILQLMNRVSAAAGLENTVGNMLQAVGDVIGGVNLILYYRVGGELHSANLGGDRKQLSVLEDDLVRRAFETREPVEREHSFSDTRMLTPEFTSAYTWAVPLLVGSEVIGVLKLESLHLAMCELSQQLPTFFSYAALVLKHEIESHSKHLQAARLAAIVEFSDDAIIGKTLEGVITSWNRGAERIYGYTATEMVGRSMTRLAPPGYEDDVPRILARLADGQHLEHYETVRRRKDGRDIHVSLAISPIKDAAGSIVGASTIARDITERKHAEEELRRVNRALRMLSDSNQALIRITDEATLLNEVCRIVVEVGGYRMAWVGFAEQDAAKTLRPVARAGLDSGYVESAGLTWADTERGRGPGGTVIRTGQLCLVRDIPNDPAFAPWREMAARCGFQSIIALPLTSEGQTFGALGIYAAEVDAFDAQEVEVLKELAGDLAFGVAAVRTQLARKKAEEAIGVSELKYRIVADNTYDWEFWLSPEGRFLYTSPSCERITGFKPADFEADPTLLDQLIHPDDRQRFAAYQREALSGRQEPEQQFRVVRPDGTERWIGHVSAAVHDETGRFLGVRGSNRDITERKRAEEALALFRALIDRTTDAVEVLDPETGRFLDVNEKACQAHGYTREEFLKLTVFDIEISLDPTNREFWPEWMKEVRSAGFKPFEGRHRRKDGSTFPVEVNVNYIRLDRDYLVSVARDITERKQAEEALNQTHQSYVALVNSIDGIVWEADVQTFAFSFVSHPAERLLGYPTERWLAEPTFWKDHLHPDDQEWAVDFCAKAVREKRSHDFEYRMLAADGRVVWLRDIVTVTVENDQPVRLRGVMVDITERKRAEEALRTSEANLQLALEAGRLGDWRWNIVTGEITWSAQCKALYGLSPDADVNHEQFLALVHPDDRECVVAALKQAVETRVDYEVEKRVIWPDGSVHWTASRGRVFCDAAGQPLHMAGVTMDISARKQAETALRESEARYRFLAEHITDVVWAFDVNSMRFTYVSPSIAQLRGVTSEEALSQSLDERLTPGSLDMVQAKLPARLQAYLSGDTSAVTQTDILEQTHKGGSLIWTEVVSTFVGDAKTGVQVIGVSRDITERHRIKLALQRDEAELSAIYDHAPVMMVLLDEDLCLRRLNQAAIEFARRPEGEVLGTRAGDLLGCLHALDDPRGCGCGPACTTCPLRLSIRDTLQTGQSHRRVEARPSLIHGRENWDVTLLASTARLVLENKPMVLLCLEDISRQKRAEEKTREQAALLEIAQDAISVLDLKGKVLFWNRGAERLYGWTHQEALDHEAETLVFGGASPEFRDLLQTVLARGEWNGELHQVTRSGTRVLTQSRATLVQDPAGLPKSILVVSTDVTEQKALEARYLRAQRMESIGSLAGGVAHDLNNILAPMLLAVDLLRPLSQRPEDEQMLNLLENSARRGAAIVKQLLTFGRGLGGERVEMQPRTLLKEMAKVIHETFPKSITLEQRFPEDLWTLRADATQIHQVLMNLCVNARDAMPRGGRLTLAAENLVLDRTMPASIPRPSPAPTLSFWSRTPAPAFRPR